MSKQDEFLRDLFAALAMQAIVCDPIFRADAQDMACQPGQGDVPANIARISYHYADAMLAARTQTPTK